MAHLIDKDHILAEIEKTYKFHEKRGNEHDSSICDVLYGLSHRIDTIEVKNVDLEKEIRQHINDCLDIKFPTTDIKMIAKDVEYTSRKFFELGLKAQKGELV